MIAMGKIRSDMLVFGVLLLIVIITFATASKTKKGSAATRTNVGNL